jgi:hypothetical protein
MYIGAMWAYITRCISISRNTNDIWNNFMVSCEPPKEAKHLSLLLSLGRNDVPECDKENISSTLSHLSILFKTLIGSIIGIFLVSSEPSFIPLNNSLMEGTFPNNTYQHSIYLFIC